MDHLIYSIILILIGKGVTVQPVPFVTTQSASAFLSMRPINMLDKLTPSFL